MKKDNKVCICCGETYKYCNSCAEYASLPQWKNIYDKIECKVIFDVATDYISQSITKEEAREKLNNYDIKNINIKESIKNVINEILDGEKIEKKVEEKVVEEVVEPSIKEEKEVVEIASPEVFPTKKPFIKNNKKK